MIPDDFHEYYNIRQLILLKIIADFELIKSKLVFQKLVFFLQCFGNKGLDYEYKRDKLGPFSGDLALDFHEFEKDGLILNVDNLQESIQIKDEDLICKILKDNYVLLQEYKLDSRTLHKTVNIFEVLQSEHNIELAATIYYLYRFEKCQTLPQLKQQIIQWKGRKFSMIEIQNVYNLLIDFHLIPQASIKTGLQSKGSGLLSIFNRFHAFASRLLDRHDQRPSLLINDEYDVQDLLNSLLAHEFDTVQKEEYGPQYAGKRPRIDFFLRSENNAIEVKYAKKKSDIAKIREEIIIDKEYYSQKENLEVLWFFIYDPKSIIIDRTIFIEDLEKNIPNSIQSIKIIIKPDL